MYIDDALLINNLNFANSIPLINTKQLEITETTETASTASFVDITLNLPPMVNSLPDFMTKETTSILPL